MGSAKISYQSTEKSIHKNSTILPKNTEVLEPGVVLSEGQTLVVRGTPNITISAYGVEVDGTSTYKILGQSRGSWDGASLYTVPSGKQAVIRAVIHSNESDLTSYVGLSFGSKSSQNQSTLVALPSDVTGGLTAVSTDGTTWFTGGTDFSSTQLPKWSDMVYAQNKFVAVSNGYASISGDGKYWKTYPSGVSGDQAKIAFGNGVFVAVGTSRVVRSTDGVTWTLVPAFAGGNLSVAFGNGVFVCLQASSATGYVSTDGLTWTSMTTPGSGKSFVTFGAGLFVAAGNFSSGITSTNGTTWTTQGLGSSSWRNISFGCGLFVVVGASLISTSTNGISWTARTIPHAAATYTSVACGPNMYVVGGSTGASPNQLVAGFSTNGISWSSVTLPGPTGTTESTISRWNALGFGALISNVPSNNQYVLDETPLQGNESLTTKAGYTLESGTQIYAVSPENVTTTIFGMEI
jgi:hypothetical protein